MTKSHGLALAEVLSARLCHELISPVGAISNGLELLDEEEGGFAADALALVMLSARQAARRLQFYRLAYGSSAVLPDEAARSAVTGLFDDSKISVDWPAAPGVPESLRKLACNLVLLAAEALPRGGRLRLDCPAGGGLSITATGEGARVPMHLPALLDHGEPAEDLTPRTVQAVFTRDLALACGTVLTLSSAVLGEVVLDVHVTR